MKTGEMTDNEVRQRVERADRFIEQLRDAITAPTSPSLRPTNKPSSEPDLIGNHQCRLWVLARREPKGISMSLKNTQEAIASQSA
jgi:hypothetical protein